MKTKLTMALMTATMGLTLMAGSVWANHIPTTKANCMDGGFARFQQDDSQRFKNQGQCIKFVNTGK